MNTYRLKQLRAASKEHLRLIPVREGGCVLRVGGDVCCRFHQHLESANRVGGEETGVDSKPN